MIDDTVPVPAHEPQGENAPVQGDYGKPAGDHDEPYQNRVPTVRWSYPFSGTAFARLLVLRGKVRAARD